MPPFLVLNRVTAPHRNPYMDGVINTRHELIPHSGHYF